MMKLVVQWYEDNDERVYLNTWNDRWFDVDNGNVYPGFKITNKRTTYTLPSNTFLELIPKSGAQSLSFHCANQIGTFYVKLLSIESGNHGTFGDFSYNEINGKIIISRYTGAGGSITIPDTINGKQVIGIVNGVFKDRTSIDIVTIGNNVTTIGYEAFSGCSSLVGVIIPNSVTNIGDNAFYDCFGLTSVTFATPSKVTSIGKFSFYNCSSLNSIIIPTSVISIERFSFINCYNLSSITFTRAISSYYSREAFDGDLREKYLAGGIGTYTTTVPVGNSVWTKEP